MSFIYDDEKLINELLKSAIDFENRFLKNAQTAPNVAPAPKPNPQAVRNSAALKLVDALERASEPGAPVISSTGDAQLKAINLENLGALIAFLVQNGVTVDQRPIALDNGATPPDATYGFYKLEGNALFNERADRARQTRGYYINKELLIKYLTSRKQFAEKEDIRVMQVQLARIIDQAKRQLGLKIVDPKEQEKEKEKTNGQPKGPSPAEITIINNMVSPGNLPLDLQTIDFQRIDRFYANMEKLLAASNHAEKASITTIITEGRGAADQAAANAKGSRRINLNGDWRYVKGLLSDGKTPISGKYQPFCDQLATVVDDAARIVDAFFAMYENTIFNRPDYAAARDAIINQSQNSNSFQVRNNAIISQWKSDRDKAVAP